MSDLHIRLHPNNRILQTGSANIYEPVTPVASGANEMATLGVNVRFDRLGQKRQTAMSALPHGVLPPSHGDTFLFFQPAPQVRNGSDNRYCRDRIGSDRVFAACQRTFQNIAPVVDHILSGVFGLLGHFRCLRRCSLNRIIRRVRAPLDCVFGLVVNCDHDESPEYRHALPVSQYPSSANKNRFRLKQAISGCQNAAALPAFERKS